MTLNNQIISKINPNSIISEQYRKLRTNIELSNLNKKYNVINLTSSTSEEGKTITCLNLATMYSQINKKTLLIDLDLRKPQIHKAFGLANNIGLSTYITKHNNNIKTHNASTESIEQYIVKADKNLDVLTTGPKVPYPAELLASDILKNIVEDLRTRYDTIIIDSPPLSPVADAKIISKLCDGTIFVIASKKVNKNLAKAMVDSLHNANVDIIGSVITQVKNKNLLYNSYYKYYTNKYY